MKMKTVLLISLLFASIGFAEDSYAEHEAKMQQMQSRMQGSDGSVQQKKHQYRNGSSEVAGSGSGGENGSGNMYQGSQGQGGGGSGRR